ncbi:sensor histidine kinase, partial [Bacteroidota bacterium]
MINLKKIGTKKPGFWFYQIAGHTVFLVIDSFEEIPRFLEDSTHILRYLLSFVISFSLTLLLRLLYRYLYFKQRSILTYALISIFSSIIGSFIWILSVDIIGKWLKILDSGFISAVISGQTSFFFLYRYLMYYTMILFGWSALYFGLKFWIDLNEEKERTIIVKQQAQEAKLKMLRYQLNPHFLFNSLNSMQGLMYHNTKLADKVLTQLSEFLRYSLVDDEMIFVPIKREIEIMEKYLSIEKIRFGKKLDYQIEVTKEVLNDKVLCFLLQPIVENAIKHGFKTSLKELKLVISAHKI